MKKKIQIGPFKFKISYKSSRWLSLFKRTAKKSNIESKVVVAKSEEQLLELKLYRIFKEEYCRFFAGKKYGPNGTEPSCYVYYINTNKEKHPLINIDKKEYLIGEFMFGEDKISFFKRKNIYIKETIEHYTIVQDNLILAVYEKPWVVKQGIYQ